MTNAYPSHILKLSLVFGDNYPVRSVGDNYLDRFNVMFGQILNQLLGGIGFKTGGNPRLDNLELVAKGLRLELLQIPPEKLRAVKALLGNNDQNPQNLLEANPWEGLLGDEE